MDLRSKKLVVLHQLSSEVGPISLLQLKEKLGQGFSERSIRRWLAIMVKEGLVEKLGEKRSTKYKIIPRKDRNLQTNKSCFGIKSEKILKKVNRPLYERMPVAYDDQWVDSYKPNASFYIPIELKKKLLLAGKRSKFEEPAGTYARQIFNRLLIDLSYNSSRLEGNTYSLLDTQKLLLEGKEPEGKLDQETIMILNHKEAIRYLVERASKLEVDEETICTIHFLLSDGLLESKYAGKIRDHGVRIGLSTYIPFEDSKQLKIRLDNIIKKAALIEDPFEQSFFLLIHISYLQAFADVNKRTARLSANIPLIKTNLVPLSFNDVEKDDYISAMIAIYELQEIHPLLDLYVFSYMRTCSLYDSTIKTLGFDEIRVRYREQRRSIIREIIINEITGKALDKFIAAQTQKLVKGRDQKFFIEDIEEDLKEMDATRIAGLGITPKQLKIWLKRQKTKNV